MRFRVLTVVMMVVAVVFAGIGAAPSVQAAPTKPTPQPFSPEQIITLYASDVHGEAITYMPVVDSFNGLRERHPAVMRRNLDTVVEINKQAAADPTTRARSLRDDNVDLLITMSDAYGARMGEMFRRALQENRLPKTAALLEGSLGRAGGPTSSTFVEKYLINYPRPFVVAPQRITRIDHPGGGVYQNTPAYPSGHTSQATWKATMMAIFVPELAPQVLARSSEVGYSRIALAVHYPLDVIGGRMMGTAAAADRWADPRFRPLILAARDEVRRELEWRCGATIAECIAADTAYLSTAESTDVYSDRMTYDFTQIAARDARVVIPPTVVSLLEAFHPTMSSAQREALVRETALEAGYPLDDQRPGRESWQRLDMARAVVPR